jgi:anaerobic selenocysteine-containing dehydrogenase
VPTVRSACPLDCPDACSLEVRVEEGRVVEVGGSRENPLTHGFICEKVRRYPEHLYGPERILHPGFRVGEKGAGRFERVSWDRALQEVADRFLEAKRTHGGEAILPYSYGGSNGYLSQDTLDARLFRRLGASRLARTVCAAPSAAAAQGLYGKMAGVSLEDYAHARLIVLWGTNPSVSGIHLVPRVYEARRRGCLLAVVDPRTTPLARKADLHLRVRPGADLPVALAIHRWLFESGRADSAFLSAHASGIEELRLAASPWTFEKASGAAGVPAADLERLARMYADSSPAVIRCGWGLERNRNGGSAVSAVLALPAVAGKFGVRGGGYTMSNSPVWNLDATAAANARRPPAREINMNLLGEALGPEITPPVKVFFVYNSNALATSPAQEKVRRGLSREDLFTVVFDSVMTDTAKFADVLLPAASFLERRELSRGYGAYVLQDAPPAVSPAGESRTNHQVFGELCRRAGVNRPGDPQSEDEIVRAIFDSHPQGDRILEATRAAGIAFPPGGANPIQFVDVLPNTADRRIHLFPAELDREAPAGLYGFRPDPATPDCPLALISPASERTISSSLGELWSGRARLEISPSDAADRGLADGDGVRVFNGLGEVRCRALVTEDVRPGVVRLPKGLWARHTDNGATANALAPDSLTDLGGGACFNDARVQVEKATRKDFE